MSKKYQIQFASSRLASVVMCINLVGLFIGLSLLSFFKVKIWHSVCKFIHSLKHLFFVNYRQKNKPKATQKQTKNDSKTTKIRQKTNQKRPKTTKKRTKNEPKTNQKRHKNEPKTTQKRTNNEPKTTKKRQKNDEKTTKNRTKNDLKNDPETNQKRKCYKSSIVSCFIFYIKILLSLTKAKFKAKRMWDTKYNHV